MYVCPAPGFSNPANHSERFIRPPLVDNSQIKAATLHNPLPLFAHLYIWPFIFIWPVFLAYYLSEERYNKYIGGQEWTFVWTASIVTLQSLAWLATKWNVNIDSLFTSTRATDVQISRLIKVIPVENAGSAEICTLERDTVRGISTRSNNANSCVERRKEEHLIPFPKEAIPL